MPEGTGDPPSHHYNSLWRIKRRNHNQPCSKTGEELGENISWSKTLTLDFSFPLFPSGTFLCFAFFPFFVFGCLFCFFFFFSVMQKPKNRELKGQVVEQERCSLFYFYFFYCIFCVKKIEPNFGKPRVTSELPHAAPLF